MNEDISLETVDELLKEVTPKVLSIISDECERLDIPRPEITYALNIKITGTGESLQSLYRYEPPTILVNKTEVLRILREWTKDQVIYAVVTALFHEFKHHIDHMKGVTKEEALANIEKYQRGANKYARKMAEKVLPI